jgi:hypothetical protein
MKTHSSNPHVNQRRWSQTIGRLSVILWLAASGVLALHADRATLDPTVTQVARRLPAPPTIDGVVNAAEWERAGGNADYWQVTPDTNSWVSGGIRGGVVGDVPELPANADDLSFRILVGYDDDNLYIAVKVTDDVISTDTVAAGTVGFVSEDDSAEVYVDGYNGNAATWRAATGDDKVGGQYAISANNAYLDLGALDPSYGPDGNWYALTALTATGYEAEFRISLATLGNPQPGDIIGFSVGVNDDDATETPGIRNHQLIWSGVPNSPTNYGNLRIGPASYTAMKVTKAPIPDGIINPGEYAGAEEVHVNAHVGVVYVPGGDDDLPLTDLDYKFQVVHDDNAVYVAVSVTDDVLSMDSVAAQIALGQTHDDVFHTWEDDSVEIFFDLDNSKNLGGSNNSVLPPGVVEGQYTLTPFNEYIFDAPAPGVINGLQWFGKAVTNATGYVIEFKFLKTTLGITNDNVSVGFHVAVNDDDVVGDYSHIGWTGQAHQEHTYGTLTLAGSTAPPPLPLRITEIKPDLATGDVTLTWEGGDGPEFQVESAATVKGPFTAVSSLQPGRVFTHLGALNTGASSFYRVRRP